MVAAEGWRGGLGGGAAPRGKQAVLIDLPTEQEVEGKGGYFAPRLLTQGHAAIAALGAASSGLHERPPRHESVSEGAAR